MKKLLLLLVVVLSALQNASAIDNLDTVYMRQQTYQIHDLKFSPDDKYILIQNYNNTAVVEAATGETVFTKYFMSFPVWSNDGKYIIALQGNALGTFWVKVETDTWKTIDSFPANSNLELFAVSPDERTAVIAKSTDILAFYDLVNKKLIKEVRYLRTIDYPKPDMYPTIVKMVWSDDGRYVIYTAHDGLIRFWEVEKDTITYTYGGGGGGSNVLSKSKDGSKIAFKTGKQGYALQIMDVTTKQIIKELPGISTQIRDLSFSSTGEYLAISMGQVQRLKVYRISSMELIREWASGGVTPVDYSRGGKYIATSIDNYLLLFNAPDVVSIKEEGKTKNIESYPNPVKDILTLKLGSDISGVVRLSVISENGSIVLTGQKSIEVEGNQWNISVDALTSGAYTAIIESGNKKRYIRFIKL